MLVLTGAAIAEVVYVVIVLTCDVCFGIEASDKLITVELELETFGKGEEERALQVKFTGYTYWPLQESIWIHIGK